MPAALNPVSGFLRGRGPVGSHSGRASSLELAILYSFPLIESVTGSAHSAGPCNHTQNVTLSLICRGVEAIPTICNDDLTGAYCPCLSPQSFLPLLGYRGTGRPVAGFILFFRSVAPAYRTFQSSIQGN